MIEEETVKIPGTSEFGLAAFFFFEADTKMGGKMGRQTIANLPSMNEAKPGCQPGMHF